MPWVVRDALPFVCPGRVAFCRSSPSYEPVNACQGLEVFAGGLGLCRPFKSCAGALIVGGQN